MPFSISISRTGNPEVLESTERPALSPGVGEVLIHNHAAAVNFIDTIIRRGDMPPGMMPQLPHVPGVEGAGIVMALGEGVKNIMIGDHVAWMGPIGAGGYGTQTVIPSAYVTKLPEELSLSIAASLPVNAMTAWHMLINLGRAKQGDTILVHAAAGGVGTMILQLARYLGVTAIASVSSEKQQYAKAQGATHVIDYQNENVSERVRKITENRGVDLTLNPIAGETLPADLDALAPMGTAIVFGFLAGPPAGTFSEHLSQHFNKSIAVRVSDIYTYFFADPEAFGHDLRTVFSLLAQGALQPQIEVLPIGQAAEAHRRLENGQTTGKLVLSIA